MLTSRFALTLLAGLALAPCSHAFASETMTPEETVAFILFGMKNGVPVYENSTEIAVTKEADTPLALKLSVEGNTVISINVKRLDDCRYDAVFDMPSIRGTSQSLRFGGVFDLSNLKSVEVGSNRVWFDGVELECVEACSDVQRQFQLTNALDVIGKAKDEEEQQAERTAAVAHFRQNICVKQENWP